MPTFAGWSLLAIASAAAIVAGTLLLAAYALRRGIVHRELDGTIEPETDLRTVEAPPAGAAAMARPGDARILGTAGAVLLAVGLGLGLLGAITGWGSPGSSTTGGPGQAPVDCAQTWEGCPQATPAAVP